MPGFDLTGEARSNATHCQVAEASQMQKMTADPIGELAAGVGRLTHTAIRPTLRKLAGTTPADYRWGFWCLLPGGNWHG